MHENNTTPEQVQASEAVAEQSYQNAVDAGARIAELEAKIAELLKAVETYREKRDTWFDKYCEAKNFIQASLDREEWTSEELSEPYWEELAELLNLDLKLEREITVTVTWNLTVKGKADLSSYDFEATIEPANGQLEFISGDGWPDIEVSE
jgi:predicted  nucleic acid-binding Zn-ribbon protein